MTSKIEGISAETVLAVQIAIDDELTTDYEGGMSNGGDVTIRAITALLASGEVVRKEHYALVKASYDSASTALDSLRKDVEELVEALVEVKTAIHVEAWWRSNGDRGNIYRMVDEALTKFTTKPSEDA